MNSSEQLQVAINSPPADLLAFLMACDFAHGELCVLTVDSGPGVSCFACVHE